MSSRGIIQIFKGIIPIIMPYHKHFSGKIIKQLCCTCVVSVGGFARHVGWNWLGSLTCLGDPLTLSWFRLDSSQEVWGNSSLLHMFLIIQTTEWLGFILVLIAKIQDSKPEIVSCFLVAAYVISANTLLAKASQMIESHEKGYGRRPLTWN